MAENTPNAETSLFNQPEGASRENRKSNRGFAAMDPEKQKQIAREGGRAAHRLGTAHKWSREEAREAGRKGGQSSRTRGGSPM